MGTWKWERKTRQVEVCGRILEYRGYECGTYRIEKHVGNAHRSYGIPGVRWSALRLEDGRWCGVHISNTGWVRTFADARERVEGIMEKRK